MKALVIADRGPKLDIAQLAHKEKVDIVITLGDLERHDLLSLKELTDVPKVGIYGNHCSGTYMEELGIVNMHLQVAELNGVTFAGLQGCVRYKSAPDAIMYNQEEVWPMLKDMPRVDVFLAHCPPRGVNDEEEVAHQGFDALRDYVERMQPRVLLHGHTYPTEENMVHSLGSTQIVYVHKYRIVEF